MKEKEKGWIEREQRERIGWTLGQKIKQQRLRNQLKRLYKKKKKM